MMYYIEIQAFHITVCRMKIPFFLLLKMLFQVNTLLSFTTYSVGLCPLMVAPVFHVGQGRDPREKRTILTHEARGVFSPLNLSENLWAIWPSTVFKRHVRCLMEPSSRVSPPPILSKILSINPLGSHSRIIGLIARF